MTGAIGTNIGIIGSIAFEYASHRGLTSVLRRACQRR
jgi:hypothetical protein